VLPLFMTEPAVMPAAITSNRATKISERMFCVNTDCQTGVFWQRGKQ
jgi:hypothetical protein